MTLCLVAAFVPLRAVVLGYAVYGALRSEFRPALALILPFLATFVMPLVASASPTGGIGAAILAWPWACPLVAALTGAELTRRAFAQVEVEPATSDRLPALETTAYALLANTLIDTGLLVVVGLASFLVSRSAL